MVVTVVFLADDNWDNIISEKLYFCRIILRTNPYAKNHTHDRLLLDPITDRRP